MTNFKRYIRDDRHGLMVIRLMDDSKDVKLTEMMLRQLEASARRNGRAFYFHNDRLVCEVEYIPQN